MNPTAGTVTSPPITAPSPSVEASRNLLRGKRSPGAPPGGARTGGGAKQPQQKPPPPPPQMRSDRATVPGDAVGPRAEARSPAIPHVAHHQWIQSPPCFACQRRNNRRNGREL